MSKGANSALLKINLHWLQGDPENQAPESGVCQIGGKTTARHLALQPIAEAHTGAKSRTFQESALALGCPR